MKKYLSLLFTFLMAFCVINTVNAETTYKVEINNANAGHTYEAYQIFKGDLSNDKLTLSNIKWGDNLDYSFINDIDELTDKTANGLAKYIFQNDAEDMATELGRHLVGTPKSTNTISNGTYTIEGLEPGYYLIKDRDGTQAANDDAYTEYIVKLIGDAKVTPKTGKPTADKKIDEGNGVTYSSKYAVGDTVGYILTGTLPTNYNSYDKYAYTFHDTLSKGLTLDENSVKVYVGTTEITTGFEVKPSSVNDGTQLDIVFANTKLVSAINKDSTITVKYNVTINSDAVRGIAGNPNTLNIEFSNNPYSNETGNTTDIITKVFVFDLILNKIDSETLEALNGAGFTLTRASDKRTWTIENLNGNEFKFEGLGVGEYTLTETTTPDGYNTLSPITFTITPVYNQTGELADLEISSTGYTFTIKVENEKAELEADIPNVKGIQLPLTGGMGTIIFTVLGTALMVIAAVGIFKNKEEK